MSKEQLDLTRYYELVPFFERFLSNSESMGNIFLSGQKPALTLLKMVGQTFKNNPQFTKRVQRHYSNILKKQGFKEEAFGDMVDLSSIWKLRALGYSFIDLLKQHDNYSKDSLLDLQKLLKGQDKLLDDVLNSFIY